MSEEAPRTPNFLSRRFALIAGSVARVTGHPLTFMTSSAVIVVWAVASTISHRVNTWQPLVNTITTVFTFLMVFLIQNTQNRNSTAVQAKLDELIRALEPANNKFIGLENRTIKEVHEMRQETVEEVKKLEELIAEDKGLHDQLEQVRTHLAGPEL